LAKEDVDRFLRFEGILNHAMPLPILIFMEDVIFSTT